MVKKGKSDCSRIVYTTPIFHSKSDWPVMVRVDKNGEVRIYDLVELVDKRKSGNKPHTRRSETQENV